jgi:hypothetical protein
MGGWQTGHGDNRAISLLIPIIFGVDHRHVGGSVTMLGVVNHSATAFLNAVRFASRNRSFGRTSNRQS